MREPRQREIWLVDLEPALGAELRKTRPVVVLSADNESALRVRVVVPLTSWQQRFARHRSKVPIDATPTNGLAGRSVADVMHTRGLSLQRFTRLLGTLELERFEAIRTALAVVTQAP